MQRRAACLAGLAALAAGPFASSGVRAQGADARAANGRLWFDPTQLPSFTGVVDRYLINPDGKTDRLLFREGPQVIFPETVGSEIMEAVPSGRSIVVYGIRARRAPVITLLAWAKDGSSPAHFVDRPTWTFPDFHAAGEAMEVSGTVRAPLLTPQGDSIGAILDDGVVIRVPPGVAAALGDRLAVGRTVAAAGRGAAVADRGRALDAERIGEAPDKLEALPPPQDRPQ
ncbi:hypothetical protein [Muricoccus vinaceus]|uniref:Uncharacterized protein n=1 Tax=Muricoccus vinaceus TaxID=424704 RepID=A0ABV6IRP8_9PROT